MLRPPKAPAVSAYPTECAPSGHATGTTIASTTLFDNESGNPIIAFITEPMQIDHILDHLRRTKATC